MEIREKLIGFKFFQVIELNAKLDARNWRKMMPYYANFLKKNKTTSFNVI